MEGATVDTSNQMGVNKDIHRTLLTHKTVGMVVPGVLALCCVVLCPCFHKKRKEMAHAALAKEPSSGNPLLLLWDMLLENIAQFLSQ